VRRQVLPEDVRPADQPCIDQDRVAAGSEFDVQSVHVRTRRGEAIAQYT